MAPQLLPTGHYLSLAALAMLLGFSPAFAEPEKDTHVSLSATGTLSSDYMFRGVSQTLGEPSLQLYAEAAFDSGLYLYVFGSNVDFIPEGEPDDDARVEFDFAVGYGWEVGEAWYADVSLVRYVFPGNTAGYDYNELIGALTFNEWLSFSLGYSNDAFGAGEDGFSYSLATGFDLPADIALSATVGHYDLDDTFDASYSWTSVGLSRAFGSFELALNWYDTYGEPDEIYYTESTGSRIELALHFSTG